MISSVIHLCILLAVPGGPSGVHLAPVRHPLQASILSAHPACSDSHKSCRIGASWAKSLKCKCTPQRASLMDCNHYWFKFKQMRGKMLKSRVQWNNITFTVEIFQIPPSLSSFLDKTIHTSRTLLSTSRPLDVSVPQRLVQNGPLL